MKVLVASCVFSPEPVVSAKTSEDVASHLHESGHDVLVACPVPSRNISKANVADRVSKLSYPFEVKRLFAISSRRSTFISRFVENISFGVSLFLFIVRQRNLDVVYANVWPLFSLGLVCLACKIKRIKLIASVQDLYPESLAAQGRISQVGLVYKILYWLDSLIARNCDHIFVISEGFRSAYLHRGIEESDITLLRNWVKSDSVKVMSKSIAREKLFLKCGLSFSEADILCVYGGNIGVASGLDEFFSAIDQVDSTAKFLLAGSGSLLPSLREKVSKSVDSSRVFFLSPWDSELTSEVLGAADILLLPTASGQEFASVPSKLITYLLSGRSIFLMADERSESAIELAKSGAGFSTGDRSLAGISGRLNELISLPDEQRSKMGINGRRYAEEFYSDKAALSTLDRVLGGI